MIRKELFEFEDFPWFPSALRNSITDFLRCYINLFNVYQPIYEDIYLALRSTNSNKILDLCSGGGGPHKKLVRYLNGKRNNDFDFKSITLTDLRPNLKAFKIISAEEPQLKYVSHNINACNVTSNFKGMRTLFTSFHHMNRTQAKLILKNAVDSKEAIGIFELTENSVFAMCRMLLVAGLAAMILIPFSRPFSIKKILLSPISALFNWWDAIASCFRTYSVEELSQLADEIDEDKLYCWRFGKKWSFIHLCNITYLTGTPKNV